MLSDSIKKWNPWWVKGTVDSGLLGIEREKFTDIKKYLKLRNIKDIIGVRRCGKSFLLYQVIQHLISSNINPRNILFLNFDENEIYNTDFDKLLLECKKINPEISYLFLDEVQEKQNWERWVRSLYDRMEFKQIFVSGSSASLLKSDISRVLTGRHTTSSLFPFSFKEYLNFHKWEDFKLDYLEYHKARVLHFMENYINEGGFPETLGKTPFERNKYLNDLFDDIVAKDIAARHNLDYPITKKIAYYITSHSSKTMTHRSIARACDVSVDTVSKYVPFICEAFLVLPLTKFSPKLKEQMREINKYYCVDTGMVNAVGFKLTDEFSRLMENLVFIELKRQHIENKKIGIFYWQDSGQKEVDFVIKDGLKIKQLIQVCYDLSEAQTRDRELSALLKAGNELKCRDLLIITNDKNGEEVVDGEKIKYIPLWKWLLT